MQCWENCKSLNIILEENHMMKKTKKMIGLLLSLIMAFTVSTTAFAAESGAVHDVREYLIVNGKDIVYVGEDYVNPDTGEYIHWNTNTRGIDKSFSFKIRYSITSDSFTVNSSEVNVVCDADVQDLYGNILDGYSGHKYTVSIIGWYARDLEFYVDGTQSGTINNLQDGGSYKVRITNNDYLSDTTYLVGAGTISTL